MSRLLASLSKDELDMAETRCAEILKSFEGLNNTTAGCSLALAVEFLLRRDMFDLEDFLQAINCVADFRDEHNIDGGRILYVNGSKKAQA